MQQELGELSDSVCKQKDVRDDLGDMMVIMLNIMKRNDVTMEECLETAYNDIVRKNFKVNNEYYLDKLLEVLNTQKHSFKEVNIKNYISLGTPKEYELNKNV